MEKYPTPYHEKYSTDPNYKIRVDNFIDRSLSRKKIEFDDFKNAYYVTLIALGYPPDESKLRNEFQAYLQMDSISEEVFRLLKKNLGVRADKHLRQLLKRYKIELLSYINE